MSRAKTKSRPYAAADRPAMIGYRSAEREVGLYFRNLKADVARLRACGFVDGLLFGGIIGDNDATTLYEYITTIYLHLIEDDDWDGGVYE